jgi:hypothetical protein
MHPYDYAALRAASTTAGTSTDASPPLPDDDRVLTAAETAKLLGVSEFTLLRKRQRPNADGLPYVMLSPKRLGYRLGDVRAYLRSRRVGSLPKEAA